MSGVPPRLAMRGVCKAFGATQALAGVDLEVARGEIHALLGENGAGKSTLMRVLAGVHAPDAGTLACDGEPFVPDSPLAARRAGIAMIHQELALCAHLTVAENVFLGREREAGSRAEALARTRAALARLGHADLDPKTRLGALAPATRQVVEIARAITHDARILVMDEPTSSLGPLEVDRLFANMRELAARGTAVVLISHSFREVRAIATRCTVLRDGRTVLRAALAEVDDDALVFAMAGRGLAQASPRTPQALGAPALRAEGVAGRPTPREATFTLHRSEVLGIFGMGGAGRTELLRTLMGLDPMRRGKLAIGAASDRGAPPRRRWAQGVGFVSEDRKGEGLALGLTIAENLTLSRLEPFVRHGCVSLRARDEAAQVWMRRLAVRATSARQRVAELSGGNQQKVALLRLLHHGCDVLLLDEPTRGIDVAGRAAIVELIHAERDAGKAILLVSSYLPELLALSDRIAVLHKGVLHPPRPTAAWDEASLLAAAASGPEAAP